MHSIPRHPRGSALLNLLTTREELTTVDDTNLAWHYGQGWIESGKAGEYNTTAHGTSTKGAQVKLQFSGSSITVLGTVDSAGVAVSSYSIDGSAPATFTVHIPPSPLFQHVFYQSPPLNTSLHTLTITVVSGIFYWLDYAVVHSVDQPSTNLLPVNSPPVNSPSTSSSSQNPTSQNPTSQSPPGQATTSGEPTSHVSATTTLTPADHTSTYTYTASESASVLHTLSSTITTGISQTTSSVPSSPVSSRSNLSISAIAGGSIAGALVLITLIFLLWRRCRRGGHTDPHPGSLTQFTSTAVSPHRYLTRSGIISYKDQFDYAEIDSPISTSSRVPSLGYVTRGGVATDKIRSDYGGEVSPIADSQAPRSSASCANPRISPPAGVGGSSGDMPPPYR